MSALRCIIVEDQPPAQRILQTFIGEVEHLTLLATFSDPMQAMAFLREHQVDLIFLDVQLPKMSGVEFLSALSHPPKVIFTTAYSDYALQGYELDVVDYLLKPFSLQRFVKAVNKVRPTLSIGTAPPPSDAASPGYFFIKSGHEHIRIEIASILFVRSDADYTEIHLPGKKHLSTDTLRDWEERLPSPPFFRVHKSYIVQLDKVERIAGNQLHLRGGANIPLGRAYKEDFMRRIEG